MAVFEIYFSDLTETAQKELLGLLEMKSEEERNWDVFPITTVEFEDDEDEE